MKVKRYIVDDVPEAVQMIRAELGSDAVILNTKEIRVGGFLGMFRQKRMEVIAAVDETVSKAPARAPALTRVLENMPKPEARAIAAAISESAARPIPSNAIRERYTQPPFSDSGRQPITGGPSAAVKEPQAERLTQIELNKPAEEQAASAAPNPIDPLDRLRSGIADRLKSDALAAAEPKPDSFRDSEIRDETSVVLQELRSLREMMTIMTKQQTTRSIPEGGDCWG